MTNAAADIRAMFDAAIAATTEPDQRAKRELLREYLTNPTFRRAFEDESYRLTGGAA